MHHRTVREWICWIILLVTLLPVNVQAAPAPQADEFAYRAPPSITSVRYQAVLCGARSPMCAASNVLYHIIVQAGLDPVLQLAHVAKESSFGTTGIGRPDTVGGQFNAHGVRCNKWDGGGCRGRFSVYTSYAHSVQAWTVLMTNRRTYVDAGRTTLDLVVPVYCPASECDVAQYINQLKGWIRIWRGRTAKQVFTPPIEQPLRDPDGRLLGVAVLSPEWITGMWTVTVQLTNYRPQAVTLDDDDLTLIDGDGRRYVVGAVKLGRGETVRLMIRCVASAHGMQLVVGTPDDPVLVLPINPA